MCCLCPAFVTELLLSSGQSSSVASFACCGQVWCWWTGLESPGLELSQTMFPRDGVASSYRVLYMGSPQRMGTCVRGQDL